MRRKDQNSTSGQIFDPKFETPMGCLLSNYEFWGHLLQDYSVLEVLRNCALYIDIYIYIYKIYTRFERKTAFAMQNFQNLGASGGGG